MLCLQFYTCACFTEAWLCIEILFNFQPQKALVVTAVYCNVTCAVLCTIKVLAINFERFIALL